MKARRKKTPGPIVPLGAYARISWQCIRCSALFDSPTGPEPFCKDCQAVLEKKSTEFTSVTPKEKP